jgi:hypothetical protein
MSDEPIESTEKLKAIIKAIFRDGFGAFQDKMREAYEASNQRLSKIFDDLVERTSSSMLALGEVVAKLGHRVDTLDAILKARSEAEIEWGRTVEARLDLLDANIDQPRGRNWFSACHPAG